MGARSWTFSDSLKKRRKKLTPRVAARDYGSGNRFEAVYNVLEGLSPDRGLPFQIDLFPFPLPFFAIGPRGLADPRTVHIPETSN